MTRIYANWKGYLSGSNRAKCRAAIQQQYIFYLLRPADYPQWFGHLRTGAFVFDLGDSEKENQ